MALEFFEGWDLFSGTVPASNTYVSGAGSNSTTTTPYGAGRALQIQSTLNLPQIAATSTVTWGSAWSATSKGGVRTIMHFNATSTNILTLYQLADGSLQVVRGNSQGSNVVGTTAAAVTSTIADVYNYIEGAVTRDASAGTLTIWVDGTSVLNLTGQNTGASDIDTIVLNSSGGGFNEFDDTYVKSDLTHLGPVRVTTLLPTSDDSVQFTPSSGTDNFSLTADSSGSDGDSTYVSDATAGHKDRYVVTDLASTPSAIYAVQPVMIARKDDATTRTVRTNLVSGATTQNGITSTMSTTYQQFKGQLAIVDPNTSATWTAGGVNAAKQELEIVS